MKTFQKILFTTETPGFAQLSLNYDPAGAGHGGIFLFTNREIPICEKNSALRALARFSRNPICPSRSPI